MRDILVYGGGTFSHVRSHLALAAPAFGETALAICDLLDGPEFNELTKDHNVELLLTRMAGGSFITNSDVAKDLEARLQNPATHIIFMNAALCDWEGQVDNVESGKYAARLNTREYQHFDDLQNRPFDMALKPADKLLGTIRRTRKDIFLVGFKTTANASEGWMYAKGLNLLKETSSNLVLVNDVVTRLNMIVTPEESHYCSTDNREKVLHELVTCALLRSSNQFTRSEVVPAPLVPLSDPSIHPTFREVFQYCIDHGAYKTFRGATAGHGGHRPPGGGILTTVRKTDYNRINEPGNGLTLIQTVGDDRVISYGAKPSVGGQSQRIIFGKNPDMDSIIHFHCPPKDLANFKVNAVDQFPYECGSHQCGMNTANGLTSHGKIRAVYLTNHGPNIVFNSRETSASEVIAFIEDQFDLSRKTGGIL